MNKNIIGNRIRAEKDNIIKLYQDNVRILDIATAYNVVESTIYIHLKRWGIQVKRQTKKTRAKPFKHWKQKKSEWLLAKQKENSGVNDKQIEYVPFSNSTEDQRLIVNILKMPIIG